MALTQANRPISISTPLGEDVLLLRAMSGTETLGRMFQYDLHLLSDNNEVKLEDILGQNVTISMEVPGGDARYFNGFVTNFAQVGRFGGLAAYHATVHPWLWFLTRTADCRIFQNKTVPEIVKDVFRDNGFTDFEESLSGEYRKWEYCVQYRESDFNFVCRLMEQEGYYFYFIHENGKHILKMTDSIGGHSKIINPNVMYLPPTDNIVSDQDYINSWSLAREVQPGTFVHDDYDFKKPKANLEAKLSSPFNHDKADGEIYDYPGEYYVAGDGNNYVKARLQELQAQYERAHGQGNVHTVYVGGLFSLTDCPREDQNREYLVVGCHYQIENNEFETGVNQSENIFAVDIDAIDSKQQFRTPRTTPKPHVQGPQTAVVTGPSGEEIWTDEFGRVKVQFHWDRYGKLDENSSCWIRVSHPWAGKNWGTIALPRIGHEVIIDFLEGDPDQPIITGRVYNGDNMPPYTLPANQTQSGMKSRSSKGGNANNFNEIRFEDKKGQEEIFVQAEKDARRLIKNDEEGEIQANQRQLIKKDRVITVAEGNESISVSKGNRTLHVKQTISTDAQDILIEGKTSIELKVGNSSIKMSPGGIVIDAISVDVKGSAIVTVEGGIVKIN